MSLKLTSVRHTEGSDRHGTADLTDVFPTARAIKCYPGPGLV